MDKKYLDVLNEFMHMSIFSTDEVFDKFSTDTNGEMYCIDGHKFYFKPGKREDRILIVAHADTVWDKRYMSKPSKLGSSYKSSDHIIETQNGYFSNAKHGIGADDRAGVAMAWI